MKRWALLLVLITASCGIAGPVPTPIPSFPNWHESMTVDSLTGKEIVAVWTDSETSYTYNGMDTSKVGEKFTPQLWIRCRDNNIDIYITTGASLGLGHYGGLMLAFYEPQTVEYSGAVLSEDGTTMFLTDFPPSEWKSGKEWRQAMSTNQRLEVTFEVDNPFAARETKSWKVATFNLTGYNEVVKPVLDACGTAKPVPTTPVATRAPSSQFSYRNAEWWVWVDSSKGQAGASTQSENSYTISDQPNVRALLQVRCKDNKIDVYVQTGAFLGFKPQDQTITYRFDEQPAQTHQFPVSGNNDSINLTDISEWMLKTMPTSQRLQVTWTPYILDAQSPVELTFSLNGYNEAIKPVLDACK